MGAKTKKEPKTKYSKLKSAHLYHSKIATKLLAASLMKIPKTINTSNKNTRLNIILFHRQEKYKI